MHSVHGSAALVAGSLGLNTESGAMTGAVTVDATTAETGNKKRDKKMHGKVLLTADHPEIVLRTSHLEGELARQGASDVTLHGEIEILGQSHQIDIPSHIEIDGGNFTATFEFEFLTSTGGSRIRAPLSSASPRWSRSRSLAGERCVDARIRRR